MKTLKTIQTLSKVAKILSTIVFVCSIIGCVSCLIGAVCLGAGGAILQAGGYDFAKLIQESSGMTVETLYAIMACSVILCAGEIAISKFAQLYFKHELEAGTPFTLNGAREMMRLGIIIVSVSIGTTIVAAIVYAIIKAVNANVGKYDVGNYTSIMTGIVFMIISLLLKHGAEVSKDGEYVTESEPETQTEA